MNKELILRNTEQREESILIDWTSWKTDRVFLKLKNRLFWKICQEELITKLSKKWPELLRINKTSTKHPRCPTQMKRHFCVRLICLKKHSQIWRIFLKSTQNSKQSEKKRKSCLLLSILLRELSMIKKKKSKVLKRHHKSKETREMKLDKRVNNILKLLRRIVRKFKMLLRQRISCAKIIIKHFMSMSFKMIETDGLGVLLDNKRTLHLLRKKRLRELLKRDLTSKIELTQTTKKSKHAIYLLIIATNSKVRQDFYPQVQKK